MLLQAPDAGRWEKQKHLKAEEKSSSVLTLALKTNAASTGAVLQPSLSPAADERTDRRLMNLILTCEE